MRCDVSALENAAGDKLDVTLLEEYYWEFTVYKTLLSGETFHSPSESGYFGEALPKLTGAFELEEGESKAIVIRVKTNADSAPGYYKADVTLRAPDGTALKSAVLRVGDRRDRFLRSAGSISATASRISSF